MHFRPNHVSSISCGISLSLFNLLERLHCTVQCVSVISSELGICAFQGRISVGLGLLDAVKQVSKRSLSHAMRES